MIEFIIMFAICVLSTYRLTQLFHEEDGPGEVIQKIRNYLGAQEFDNLSIDEQNKAIWDLGLSDEDELPLYDTKTFFGELFNCVRCLSIWTALPHAITLWLTSGISIVFVPILTLAISAIVVEIHEK